MNPRILVACIGNIFLGDDGFGVEVARALAGMELPADVRVVDYGIRGLDLTYALLDPWQVVVLVDTVARGEVPGTVSLLRPGEGGCEEAALDAHAMDPVQVLNTAKSLGEVRAEIYIVGCEPRDFGHELEGRMGLSAAVEAAVPEASRMVRELVVKLLQNIDQECVAT